MVGYAYAMEFFIAWYSGNPYEQFQFLEPRVRADVVGRLDHGHLQRDHPAGALVQASAARTSGCCSSSALLVNVGMWFERFVIIVVGCSRDFLPSSWGSYAPSYVEVLTLMGSFGLFLTLFLLFCRYLPMVAMAEVKGVLPANVVPGRGSGYAQNKAELELA